MRRFSIKNLDQALTTVRSLTKKHTTTLVNTLNPQPHRGSENAGLFAPTPAGWGTRFHSLPTGLDLTFCTLLAKIHLG